MPIGKSIASITEADLQDLLGQFEPKTIDFKEKLPGGSDGEKREFLADVSSFANSVGGDLVFGIRSKEGQAVEVCGVDGNPDKEILRLENVARDGLAPRIPGLQTAAIPLENSDRIVIVMRIPSSWASPHMVTFGGSSRFFSRTSNGKYQLDVVELRGAFLASEAVPERIRSFRAERIGKIVAGETPTGLLPDPLVVLHVVPYSALKPGELVDVTSDRRLPAKLPQIYGGSNSRLNFDGLLNASESGYVQLFRSGNIEAVDTQLLGGPVNSSQHGPRDALVRRIIPNLALERNVIRAVGAYLNLFRELGSQPPVAVMLSLLNVEEYTVSHEISSIAWPIDRPNLMLPEVLAAQLDANVGQLLRPAFDIIWNACGCTGSPNYDPNGEWVGR